MCVIMTHIIPPSSPSHILYIYIYMSRVNRPVVCVASCFVGLFLLVIRTIELRKVLGMTWTFRAACVG
jgi:hypothetical protein